MSNFECFLNLLDMKTIKARLSLALATQNVWIINVRALVITQLASDIRISGLVFSFRGAEAASSRAAMSLSTILLLKQKRGETKRERKGDKDITDR